MAKTAFIVQRLSDGGILLGYGKDTEDGENPPFGSLWGSLTGAQLEYLAHWVVCDVSDWNNSARPTVAKLIDNVATPNGDWDQDLYRVLPIMQNV